MTKDSSFYNHAVLEVDSKAVEHNFNYFKSLISPNTKMMAMVKSNAYGLGAVKFSQLFSHLGIDYLGVAYFQEAIELRDHGISTPIMVMNTEQNALKDLIQYRVEPTLYNFNLINSFGKEVHRIPNIEEYPVHVEINTGMNRLGFSLEEIPKILEVLKKFPKLRVKSVFSHFATSDEPSQKDFTLQQISIFKQAKKLFLDGLEQAPMFHISNSSGASNFPSANLDMVRMGIGLYGFSPYPEHQKNILPVAYLKTFISQIHQLKEGESVSYGRRFIAETPTKTATISIGYGDGVPRLISVNGGKVLINGNLVPTIGSICMDMLMVDVTNIDCEVGDEVTIFGQNPSLNDVAKWAQTIPYEILTSISKRVKRIYL